MSWLLWQLRVAGDGPVELVHFEVQLPTGAILNVIVPSGSLIETVKQKVPRDWTLSFDQ